MVVLLTHYIWYWLRSDKSSAFHKVQRLRFTGAVDKFVIVWCDVSSGSHVPRFTKIG